jgi:hypothetical protein
MISSFSIAETDESACPTADGTVRIKYSYVRQELVAKPEGGVSLTETVYMDPEVNVPAWIADRCTLREMCNNYANMKKTLEKAAIEEVSECSDREPSDDATYLSLESD